MRDKLDDLIAEFQELDPRERLELLLEFAEGLPELPGCYRSERDAGRNRVRECQTAVYLWVEAPDGRLQIFADVAPEAPTVKGFVAMLVNTFCGATLDDIRAVPADLIQRLGLDEAMGMTRMRGMSGILNRIRGEAERHLNMPS